MRKMVLAALAAATFTFTAPRAWAQAGDPSAATGFAALEEKVPADLADAAKIAEALMAALAAGRRSDDPAFRADVNAIQRECFGDNPKLVTGALGPVTQACVRDHAAAMARARAGFAAERKALGDETDRVSGELRTCIDDAVDCATERDRLKDELAAEAKVKTGGGDLAADSDVVPIASAQAFANKHCAPGSQPRWLTPTSFTCTDPVFRVVKGDCALGASGRGMSCDVTIESPKGREEVVPLPNPPPPPPSPPRSEAEGWCGGDWMCRMMTVASGAGAAASAVALGFSVRERDSTAIAWSTAGLGSGVAGAVLSPVLESWIPGALGTTLGVTGVSVAGSRGVFFQIKR